MRRRPTPAARSGVVLFPSRRRRRGPPRGVDRGGDAWRACRQPPTSGSHDVIIMASPDTSLPGDVAGLTRLTAELSSRPDSVSAGHRRPERYMARFSIDGGVDGSARAARHCRPSGLIVRVLYLIDSLGQVAPAVSRGTHPQPHPALEFDLGVGASFATVRVLVTESAGRWRGTGGPSGGAAVAPAGSQGRPG